MPDLHVLVPLDGSGFSRSALGVVQTLFAPDAVRLTLLRVGESPRTAVPIADAKPGMVPDFEPSVASEARVWPSQEWESARQRLRDDVVPDARRLERDGWTVDIATAFGDPSEEIVAWCGDHAPDLVAMATHGRTGLSRALLGSVAERALRNLSVPVLMLRPQGLADPADLPVAEADVATG